MFSSPVEAGIVLLIFLLLFGYRKLPDLGRGLGEAIAEIGGDADERE